VPVSAFERVKNVPPQGTQFWNRRGIEIAAVDHSDLFHDSPRTSVRLHSECDLRGARSIWSGEPTSSATDSGRGRKKKARLREKLPMIQRRLRVVKWLSTTPAIGVCTLCSREFKVPMSALMRTADAQQFEGHKCEPEDTSQDTMRGTADVLLRQEPDEAEDEEEDEGDRKEEHDDDDIEGDGCSE
jgi:hypothetical protein